MSIKCLRLFPDNLSIDFLGKKKITLLFSILLTIASFFYLFQQGLNYGIDFTGGVLIEANLSTEPDLGRLRHLLNEQKIGEVSLQNVGNTNNNILIRVGEKKNNHFDQTKTVNIVKQILTKNFTGDIEYRKIDYVGPQVGQELIKNGILAVIFSFLSILIYIWFRFEWQYGVGLLVALIHDAIVTVGFMSVTNLEFNLTSIAAILTIIGYSVNDSVVIYDRIRENMRKYRKMSVEELINLSINSTLSRTILTVVTTLLATLALILYGGEAIRSFSLVVFFGIVMGTYSSICVSAPILVYLGIKKR